MAFARRLGALLTLLLTGALGPAAAVALTTARSGVADGGATTPGQVIVRSPAGPPLTPAEGTTSAPTGQEITGNGPAVEADPLVSNGLDSPLCQGALGRGELTATGRRHCETSGFVAAGAPTGNYGVDVHIDTGVLGLSSGGLLSVVQDLFVTPVWMALVWAVHALVVMLEWCFTIDLLDSSAANGVGHGLRQMQATLTLPWLATLLAVAAVAAAYNGLIRRRVADTLGQAVLTAVLIVAGMGVILDPSGTVGALGGWANQASLGTLAVAASGQPGGPGQALGQSMETIFAAAIETPWCYLEFGNVGWCEDPARLDSRLRAAALAMATRELAAVGCKPSVSPLTLCIPSGSPSAAAIEHSAQLLREARSNGAIFLALPANGPARNSINESGSLLRAICQGSEATNCHGPAAAEAEFRTNGGTWARVGGLLLIVAGAVGMLLLLCFIALRLLGAAVFSLLYLLLAPGMVLAPALGESGRAIFRRWLARLLGAVVSKLLFSFLLGVVFAVLAVLSQLRALGWWTQWLLMSAFWWGAFSRRNQLLGAAEGALGGELAERRSLARRMSESLESRRGMALTRWMAARRSRLAPSAGRRGELGRAARDRVAGAPLERAGRRLDGARRDGGTAAETTARIHALLSDKRAQLARVQREHARALAVGDTRRAAELGHRRRRVGAEIDREREALESPPPPAGSEPRRGKAQGDERLESQRRFLDEQAALPPASQRTRPPAKRRDYAALAGVLGYGCTEYGRLGPREQRRARLEIDRELALRKELGETDGASTLPRRGRGLPSRGRRGGDGQQDRTLRGRVKHGDEPTSAFRGEPATGDSVPRPRGVDRKADAAKRPGVGPESSVMRDAREVAEGRKRQLGRGRP